MMRTLRRIGLPLILLVGTAFWLLPLVNALIVLGSLFLIVAAVALIGRIRGRAHALLSRVFRLRYAGALLVVLAGTLPMWAGPFELRFMSEVLILGLLAMSLDLMMGYIGLASFAHAALAGVGSYAAAIVLSRYGWSPWAAIGFALLVGTTATTCMGAFSVRVRDIYFGIVTLVFGVVAFIVANTWVSMTNGEDGMTIKLPLLAFPGLPALDVGDFASFWYLTFVVVFASYLFMRQLLRSPIGLVFRGIRENEQRARYIGYNVNAYKILNTAISGFFASLAGVLLLFKNGIIGTEQMDVIHSGEIVIWSVIGGLGTLVGPFIGAAGVYLLTDYLAQFTNRYILIVGLVFITTILLAPRGIAGAIAAAWRPATTDSEDTS